MYGGQGSLGNGAAMRVAPLGLFFHDAPDLYDQAVAAAALTHAHPLAQDGAAVQAAAVAMAVHLDPRKPFPQDNFLRRMLRLAKTSEIKEKLSLVRTLLKGKVPGPEAARILGKSVRIDKSLPFAIYAFLAQPHSFENCLMGCGLERRRPGYPGGYGGCPIRGLPGSDGHHRSLAGKTGKPGPH